MGLKLDGKELVCGNCHWFRSLMSQHPNADVGHCFLKSPVFVPGKIFGQRPIVSCDDDCYYHTPKQVEGE